MEHTLIKLFIFYFSKAFSGFCFISHFYNSPVMSVFEITSIEVISVKSKFLSSQRSVLLRSICVEELLISALQRILNEVVQIFVSRDIGILKLFRNDFVGTAQEKQKTRGCCKHNKQILF